MGWGRDYTLANLGKVQGVIIKLRSNENAERSKNLLIAMLEELLRKDEAENKKKQLSEDFGLIMSTETERRVNDMCNLSEVILERGIGIGLEKGKGIGLEQGKSIGEISGKVIARFEDGMTIEEIARKSDVSVEVVEKILKEKKMIEE